MSDQELRFRFFLWGSVFTLIKILFVGGIVLGTVGFFYLSVDALAGRTTIVEGDMKFDGSVSAMVKLVTNKHMGEVLAYTLTVLTGGAYLHDRVRRPRMLAPKKQSEGGRRAA